MTFDAVLCDVDNVIRFYDNSALARSERESGLREGITAQVAFAPETDMPLLLGEITKQEWVESIAIALVGRARISEACALDLGRTLATASFRADGAVVEMLRKVRTQMPLVLVSNATVELEEELASLGLAQLADHVVNSARVGVAKPDRRIYEMAARRAGVAVGRCLFVDDGRANVDAAVALGMTGVHFRQPADLRAVLGPVLGS